MTGIKELKRDDSLDYLKIIKSLMQIPFPVGKNLLHDFLKGNYQNSSIKNNKLNEMTSFGSLPWEKEKFTEILDKLIKNKLIEQTSYNSNRFAKVLKVTLKGQNEIINPTLNKQKKIEIKFNEFRITQDEKKKINEYNNFLKEFNDEQKKAIICENKRILTIAGAGSGKTTVLVKRIEFLVKYKNVNPNEILAITFTRKAKTEMEKRLKELDIENVHVATFNSFSEQILRKYGKEFYGRNVRVMSYADKILALNIALYNLNLEIGDVIKLYFSSSQQKNKETGQLQNIFLNDCFGLIDYFKITGKELYDFSKNVFGENDKETSKKLYQTIKYLIEHQKTQGLRSFTDQLIDVIELFKKKPSFIPYYEHVLVDEYQDVNSLQVEILNLLNFDNLFTVGDPRQSIFGWRGSDMRFIFNFEKDFGESQIIHLTRNYRSSKKIVELINLSIKEMELPDLKYHNNEETNIKLFSFKNEEAERSFVLQVLENLLNKDQRTFILSRTNRQITEISEILKQKKMDFVLKTDEFNGNKNSEVEEKKLVLATIHAIKGLEADNVFLIGANTDYFPCRTSDHPILEIIKTNSYDKEDEEKRLFYVGLSRAKKNLFISYSGSKTDFITNEMEDFIESL